MNLIITTLKNLSEKELTKLGLFLESPIFNTQTKQISFFELLHAASPDYNISKEAVFEQLYKGKVFNARSFRRLEKSMEELLEKFLQFIEFQNRPQLQKQLLLNATADRNLTKLFERTLAELKTDLDKNAKLDLSPFYYRYTLQEIEFRFALGTENRSLQSDAKIVIQRLEEHYLINKLRFILVILNQQRILNTPNDDLPFLANTLLLAESVDFEKQPLLHLYYLIVLLFYFFEEENHYPPLKKLFKLHKNNLSDYELRQFSLFLITYCRIKILAGKIEFKREEFFYYQTLIEHQALYVLTENAAPRISPNLFRNIVEVSLDMARWKEIEFSWVTNFIAEYKDKVLEKYRDAVYNFAMANVHFAQGDFSKTQDYMVAIQFEEEVIDFFYTIYYKTLQIQTAYELDEWEPLLSALEAFRLYLSRHKRIAPDFQDAYDNFRKLVSKIFNKKIGKRIVTDDLIAEIKNTKPLREMEWLLAKAALVLDD